MLVDVCTFVGLVILYLVYDWYAVRKPAVPAGPGVRNRGPGPAPRLAIRCRVAPTRLTLVPGRRRRQPVAKDIGRRIQHRAS
jgi:hypothetical protein